MATTLTKLYPTGILQSSVAFDEVTQSTIKNLFTYTEQFDNAIWGKQSGITVTPNTTISPNGTLTADTLTGGGASVGYLTGTFSYTSGVAYTFSVYAKANATSLITILLYGTNWNSGGGNIIRTFNLSAGTSSTGGVSPENYGMIDCGNGWYRCWITKTATSSGSSNNQVVRLNEVSDSIYVWGYQVESGSTLTPYQGIGASGVIVTPDYSIRVSTTGVYSAFFDEVTQPPIKNLLTYTEQFNQTYYDKTRSNIGRPIA